MCHKILPPPSGPGKEPKPLPLSTKNVHVSTRMSMKENLSVVLQRIFSHLIIVLQNSIGSKTHIRSNPNLWRTGEQDRN